ncbi:MAG TPA: exo-alpha-sialidase, partial [Gammaproteobacteria bacterium]
MAAIRILVGTKKGAFILTADGNRESWSVSGPHFAGWEVYHMKGSPADPDRIFASQTSSWFGQIIQRSSDGGETWEQPGSMDDPKPEEPSPMPQGESNKFAYDTSA